MILLMFAGAVNADDTSQELFLEHAKQAQQWLGEQKNIQLSKSHFSPKFRNDLSILKHNEQIIGIDYYWTYQRKYSDGEHEGNYLFKEGDILVRYDTESKSFRLIYYKK